MSKKGIFQIAGILFIFALGLFLSNLRLAEAADYRMINVFNIAEGSVESDAPLVPKEASLARGSTVIWFNRSQSEIKILFQEGKTCKLSTTAATGWHLSEACFITKEAVPPGGTSSVVFNEKGRYDYEIQYVGQDQKAKGSVVVW